MCKIYGKKLDDPWFDEIDPLMKLLYHESLVADLQEQHAFARNYAIFTGSFTNMEMAKHIISEDKPNYSSTDSDFSESIKMVVEGEKPQKRRKRKVMNISSIKG